jgi:diaminopimelate epimerase
MKVKFLKASGAGNDFVILDAARNALPADLSTLARTLCRRHLGIGADGVLFIEPGEKADFRMNYYNADGSVGGMCGNGGRCFDVESIGRAVRYHAAFAPAGTNADFVTVSGHGLYQRTYERGVEAETLACGTGSVASAIVSALTDGIGSPVEVRVLSGEVLRVYFDRQGESFVNVWLEGSARMLFSGEADVSDDLEDISIKPGNEADGHYLNKGRQLA